MEVENKRLTKKSFVKKKNIKHIRRVVSYLMGKKEREREKEREMRK